MTWELEFEVDGALTGDRIRLPSQLLQHLIDESSLKTALNEVQPWTFQLETRNERRVFAAVREFTAPNGHVVISPWLNTQLFPPISQDQYEEDKTLTVRTARLKKGVHCVLQTIGQPSINSFSNSLNIRDVLESELRRNFTTLTRYTTIETHRHTFRVDSLVAASENDDDAVGPSDDVKGVVIVDTELSVDLKPLGDGSRGQSVAFQMDTDTGSTSPATNETTLLQLDHHPMSLKLSTGEIKYFKMPDSSVSDRLGVFIEIESGDVDFFASVCVDRPSRNQCDFYNVETGTRKFHISFAELVQQRPLNALAEPGFVYMAFVVSSSNSVMANITFDKHSSVEHMTRSEPSHDDKSTTTHQQCENCKSYIPLPSLTMHQVFCARNNVYCDPCRVVILKKDFDAHWHCPDCDFAGHQTTKSKHIDYFHTLITCACSIQLFWKAYLEHVRVECPKRLIQCRFCHVHVEAGPTSRLGEDAFNTIGQTPLSQHESECGSRTIECRVCKKSVIIKAVQVHMTLHKQERKLAPRLPFQCCANSLCSRRVDEKNDMRLCMLCFSPFWGAFVNSSAVMSGHAVDDEGPTKRMQKLIRKYFTQISQGCGDAEWCINPYCRSNSKRVNQVSETEGDPNAVALLALELARKSSLVVAGVSMGLQPGQAPVYYLCMTDRKSVRLRRMADEKLTPLGYALEWCITALEKTERAAASSPMGTRGEGDTSDSEDDEEMSLEKVQQVEQAWLTRAVNWLVQNAPSIEDA